MEMTYTAIFNRCVDDNDYPAFMAIQSEMDKDLKDTKEKIDTIRKAQNYYDADCIKYYELEVESCKLLAEFYEKLIMYRKFNSAPEVKYRAECEYRKTA